MRQTYFLTFCFLAFALIVGCAGENGESKVNQQAEKQEISSDETEEIELAVYMARLQRYLEKAYWSAQEGNKDLHNFYVHEMEEIMEAVYESGVVDEGVNVSYNMLQYGLKSLEVYEKRIEEEGFSNYSGHFENLINGCNSCHLVSKKGMIKIQIPTVNTYSSQSFKP
ncbi:MAG: hypothetical protein ACPF8V_08310 [Luteibaculum sp.]